MTKPSLPSTLSMVFSEDPTLGTDPLDEAREPRRQGWMLNMETEDFVLIHREWGDQFEGGSRTHVWSGGVWENLPMDDVVALLESMDRPLDPG